MKKVSLRKAIAMIELIFAIVILGIVMMSAPMLSAVAGKSGESAFKQESISAVASQIGMVLTYHWDENNTDVNLSVSILNTGGDVGLAESTDSNGNPSRVRGDSETLSSRSFLTSTGERLTSGLSLGNDGDIDDIDDFIGVSSLTDAESTTSVEGDYLDTNIVLTTNVTYINDSLTSGTYSGTGAISYNLNTTAVTANTTNIKLVEVRLTTTNTQIELSKDITLKAFSCNIGGYILEERSF